MQPTQPSSAPRLVDRGLSVPARVVGSALATSISAIARVRPAQKPLHPHGEYAQAVLTRNGIPTAPTGVPWLDAPGSDRATVRLSRAVGLPQGWYDVQGFAVRVDLETGHADLLFASTGLGRLTRFVLTISASVGGRPYTTLLPYRGPHGPLLLAARAESERAFELFVATGTGPWTVLGRIQLEGPYSGPTISFDPIRFTLPGLPPYAWVRAIRLPAYRAARRSRRATGSRA